MTSTGHSSIWFLTLNMRKVLKHFIYKRLYSLCILCTLFLSFIPINGLPVFIDLLLTLIGVWGNVMFPFRFAEFSIDCFSQWHGFKPTSCYIFASLFNQEYHMYLVLVLFLFYGAVVFSLGDLMCGHFPCVWDSFIIDLEDLCNLKHFHS